MAPSRSGASGLFTTSCRMECLSTSCGGGWICRIMDSSWIHRLGVGCVDGGASPPLSQSCRLLRLALLPGVLPYLWHPGGLSPRFRMCLCLLHKKALPSES
jgi:hypothetical protein